MKDLCSIVIPAYNKADKTVRAIESCLKQSYPCEVIVIDDSTNQETSDKMFDYWANNKIVFIRNASNYGASYSRNMGIKEARGKYIAFLDCDDYYEPDKIEKSIAYLTCYPQYSLVHTSVYVPGYKNISGEFETKVWLEPEWVEKKPKIGNLLFRNYIFNSTPVIRRSRLMDNLFDESLFIAADWDIWLRLSEIEFFDLTCSYMKEEKVIGYLDQPLTYIGGLEFPKRIMIPKKGNYDTLGTCNQGFKEPLWGTS